MRHGLNLEQIRKICKKHFLAMLHIEGTIEADMVSLVNEILRLRGIMKKHGVPTDGRKFKPTLSSGEIAKGGGK